MTLCENRYTAISSSRKNDEQEKCYTPIYSSDTYYYNNLYNSRKI